MASQVHSHTERLRPKPEQRFAGPAHAIDINDALQKLHAEPVEPGRGHRQIALYHRLPTTIGLFSFEAGGELPDHSAHGLVIINVLKGRIRVHARGQDHDLSAGGLLVLDPDVVHNLKAEERSVMLLTVQLDDDED